MIGFRELEQVVDLLRLNLERDTSRRDALTDPVLLQTHAPYFAQVVSYLEFRLEIL